MAADAQHIIIKTTNGNFATTSFGPRKTNSAVPLSRPLSWVKRQVVLQMNGDDNPVVDPDLADESVNIFPAGSFITDLSAWSETGAAVTVNIVEKVGGAVAALPAVAPAAGEWARAVDVDQNIKVSSSIGWEIGAGETAVVLVEFLAPETKGDGGVLHRTRDNAIVPGVDTL